MSTANAITVNGTLQVATPTIAARSLSIASKSFTLNGSNFINETQTIPTTAGGTAISLGGLGSVGWSFLINNDVTNIIRILNAVSGTPLLDIQPGEFALFRFAASVSAPAALALVASCQLEYLICEN
jgi:hypothetical protein